MLIEYDKEQHCITIGDAKFTSMQAMDNKALAYELINRNKKHEEYKDKYSLYRNSGLTHPHAERKAIGDVLGCSSSQLTKHFNKLQYKVFYHPIKDAISSIPACSMRNKERYVNLANNCLPIIEQLRKDNLIHLAPICIVLGKNPQGCKESLGKGLWKQLTKQSKSRLGKIATVIQAFKYASKGVDHYIKISLNTPSALLIPNNIRWFEETPEIIESLKKFTCISKAEEVASYVHCYRDTKIMQKELNENISIKNLNKEELVKYHDSLSARIKKLRNPNYFNEIPNYFELVSKVKNVDTLGYELCLLRTGNDIVQEGEKQNHCIGMYAKAAYRGDTLLFSLRKEGEIYSSFMLNKQYHSDNQWCLVQHYKKFNQEVDDTNAHLVVNYVLSELNK